MEIYLDFDGTLVEHKYPIIGEQNPNAFEVLDKLIKAKHKIILNTMRVEFQNGTFEESINYIKNELFKIDSTHAYEFEMEHTLGKILPPKWDWDRHLAEQCIYIDDICEGTPMSNNIITSRQLVDWTELDGQFRKYGVY